MPLVAAALASETATVFVGAEASNGGSFSVWCFSSPVLKVNTCPSCATLVSAPLGATFAVCKFEACASSNADTGRTTFRWLAGGTVRRARLVGDET